MNILGISCYYHDSAAALICDGELVAAAQEERFSRVKGDRRFPSNAIRFCLMQARSLPDDLDHVVFYEKPFTKLDRIVQSCLQTFPGSYPLFREAMGDWLLDKLWVDHTIQESLKIPKSKVLYSRHHLSHAASSFFCSPYQEAAILTLDGVGEWTTAAMGVGKGNQISMAKEIRFPHSIGLLYSVFTSWLGFEVNEGEYKVMGMAAYGRPIYVDKVRKLIETREDGSFWLDMKFFSYHYALKQTFRKEFLRLFGEPRDPKSNFFTPATGYPSYFGEKPSGYDEIGRSNQYYADIAASLQVVVEEAILNMVRALHEETGLTNLCMAGGVALNSVVNGRILRESPIRSLYVQPAAGDAGAALGAALYAYHMLFGYPRNLIMDHVQWGAEQPEAVVSSFLDAQGIHYEYVDDEERLIDRVVDDLDRGKVVGWHQGRFEWGPRALGNRSILADPRRWEMKDIVNVKIKFREPYRPFAPSVLAGRVQEYFAVQGADGSYPERFMLAVTPALDNSCDRIPAVVHVDGTSRLQVVHEQTTPRYYRLIKAFEAATGCPVVLNTSFNLKGEPIVSTAEDSLRTFHRSGLDTLVIENFLVSKESP
jgi:carbamoyltransferase